MKISKDLSQFEKGSALFIVAGTFAMNFYAVNKGEINKIDSFEVKSTNRKAIPVGFVTKESGGKKMLKRSREADFFNLYAERLKGFLKKQSVSQVYLFAPAKVSKELAGELPAKLKKNLKTFEGNYHKKHPFKLLEKINVLK